LILQLHKCPSCQSNLDRPTTLPCGYTVCQSCANKSSRKCVSPECTRSHTTPSLINVTLKQMQDIVLTILTIDELRTKLENEMECIICCIQFTQPATTSCGHTFCHSYVQMEEDNTIPILAGALAFPHNRCVIHIFEPRYKLMLRRIMDSQRRRFAMCLSRRRNAAISSVTQAPFFEYGTMLELTHVQTLPDGRSVVEAIGSHRFRVLEHQLVDGYHVGQVERVDDIDAEQEQARERRQIMTAGATRARQQREAQINQQREAHRAPSASASASGARPGVSPMGIGQRQSWASRAHPQTQATSKAPWLQVHLQGVTAAQPKPQRATPTLVVVPATISTKSKEEETTEDLLDQLASFVESLLEHQRATPNDRFSQWLAALGEPPVVRGPNRDRVVFTWWVANMMPLDEEEKSRLLAMTSVRERVLTIAEWIEKFKDQWTTRLHTDQTSQPSMAGAGPASCTIS
ncbi:PUA-like domain-containing protein, partial [Phycomyces nitens]